MQQKLWLCSSRPSSARQLPQQLQPGLSNRYKVFLSAGHALGKLAHNSRPLFPFSPGARLLLPQPQNHPNPQHKRNISSHIPLQHLDISGWQWHLRLPLALASPAGFPAPPPSPCGFCICTHRVMLHSMVQPSWLQHCCSTKTKLVKVDYIEAPASSTDQVKAAAAGLALDSCIAAAMPAHLSLPRWSSVSALCSLYNSCHVQSLHAG